VQNEWAMNHTRMNLERIQEAFSVAQRQEEGEEKEEYVSIHRWRLKQEAVFILFLLFSMKL